MISKDILKNLKSQRMIIILQMPKSFKPPATIMYLIESDPYQWVLKNSILDLRHNYIHNDDEFKQLKGDIENYIRNKIRSRSDGLIYMKVKDITFDGNQDQYKDHLVKNKTKLFSLIRKIVDDLNGFLNGEAEVDKNKPVLNDDYIREEVVEEVPVIEEEAPAVVEEERKIFIGISLSLKVMSLTFI